MSELSRLLQNDIIGKAVDQLLEEADQTVPKEDRLLFAWMDGLVTAARATFRAPCDARYRPTIPSPICNALPTTTAVASFFTGAGSPGRTSASARGSTRVNAVS